ncbi:MAG: ribosome silencing factor [Anaerostipes sp.]|nr:ribosome silencing factor [Anaerostipes sp.]
MEQSLKMVKLVYDALDKKLAEDIQIIDIRKVSVIADYFIIATGKNKNHVQTLIDDSQEALETAGFKMREMEGYRNGSWILMDFGDIVVHIFDEESRNFYDLERIWKDGKIVTM